MRIKFVQRIIDKIRKKKKPKVLYKTLHLPIYNLYEKIDGTQPEIYNKYGEKMKSVFIRDSILATWNSVRSRYIYWDKYNFALDYHFYTHKSMLETMGNPKKKYGALIETQGIVPDDYRIFDKYKGLNKDFDLIFTYDEKILNEVDNAKFMPFWASIKLDFKDIEGSLSLIKDDTYKYKTKNVSILSSNKVGCPLHKLRYDTAKYIKQNNLADTFGTFESEDFIVHMSDKSFVRAYDTLANYRFSIIFENIITDYCFTEKLTNCFAMQTIPIYIGARKISEFFNPDGIIQISVDDVGSIEKILKNCTEEEYNSRLSAVLDNYNRSLMYKNVEDYMYEKYLKKDIER